MSKTISSANFRASYAILILMGLLILTLWWHVDQSSSTQNIWAPQPFPGYQNKVAPRSPKEMVTFEPNPKCSHVLTLLPGGRWANLVMEYGSLYGLIKDHKAFGIKPVLNDEMKTKLKAMFPNLSIPSFSEMGCSDKNLPFVTTEQVMGGLLKGKWNNSIISLPKYWLREKYLEGAIDDLKHKDFQFNSTYVECVQKKLYDVKEHFLQNRPELDQAQVIYVGLHVRRTDYPRYLKFHNGTPVTEKYFYKAMNMFRDKFGPSVIFVSATDDPKWVIRKFSKFSDVYFSSNMDTCGIDAVHFDFTLLSHCNHSIYSYGTYGFMTSVLAGGHVIASHSFTVDQFLAKSFTTYEKGQNWTLIKDPASKS